MIYTKYSVLIFICLFNLVLCSEITNLNDDDDRRMHPDLDDIQMIFKNTPESKTEYWHQIAKNLINEKLKVKPINKKAKNVILFLGDGMSVHTLTATRAYLGDVSKKLSFEKFPYMGLSKTYCVDAQVADSACTATAYLTGVKNNIGMIGVTASVKKSECDEKIVMDNRVDSIAKWAQESGKSTGIVTTTRVTHATPSGTYAHIAHRDWECDAWISKECKNYKITDIAQQLIHGEVGKNFNVILGGGRSMFLDESINDEEGVEGTRKDGKNLIKEWLDSKEQNKKNAKYVWNQKGLLSLDISKTDYVLGLFNPQHMPYNNDRIRQLSDKADPSLSEMTEVAIKILSKNPNGFFLLVEGGRIDHAHHYVKARKALEETVEFANAVDLANRMLGVASETLIVVTSDHSHTMSINGYPNRHSDILGLSGNKDDDKLSYSTLSYANGNGYFTVFPKNLRGKRDLNTDDFTDPEYDYPSHVPLEKETHGGDDVGVFATGPQANLFVGNYEQSFIPLLMAKIAEIGPYKK